MDENFEKCHCCFCDKEIKSDKFNPCDLIIGTNWDKPKDKQQSQFFWCHLECFRDKLHENMRIHFLLHLVSPEGDIEVK